MKGMKAVTTRVLTTATQDEFNNAVEQATELLRKGETVAIPTETVYGLAANAFDEAAIEKIFKAKGRPQDNPLIVHISDLSQLESVVLKTGDIHRKLAEAFWPGPLTIIFPKGKDVPECVTAGLDSVAVRMPAHKVAREIIRKSGLPLAAPSANISGKPSTTRAKHVFDDLNGKIPLIIDGGDCEVGVESTVVSVKANTITVLRPGGITVEMLKDALPEAEISVSDAVMRPLEKGEAAPSPGMRHKHYSPIAKVILCNGDEEKIVTFVNSHVGENAVFIGAEDICSKVNIDKFVFSQGADGEAKYIFDFLRRADENGYNTVMVSLAENSGIGLAVNNRLLRAAGFEVLEL